MNCMVCDKHQDFEKVTGQPLLVLEGWYVSHFPILEGQRATRGHLLIETKRHIKDFSELTDLEASNVGLLIKKSVDLVIEKFGAEHAYFFRINDKVEHLHFHVIPRYPNTPKEHWGLKIMEWAESPKIELKEIQALK